jgi:hypothetical protein
MPLQPPKRTSAGYYLSLTQPITAPSLAWDTNGVWVPNEDWGTWAGVTRSQLLGELLSHGNWFSRPPRQDILDPLFGPWEGRTMQGCATFFCKTPDVPGDAGCSGNATWQLQGLMMTASAITPVWTVSEFKQDEPEQDTISLFGDVNTVDGSDDEEEEGSTREIKIEDIEDAPPAEPTRIRSRDWEARKFLSKDRVREARLKAKIAQHMARKEEARFYAQYGDLDDGESHFSEYDITDTESSVTSASEEDLE